MYDVEAYVPALHNVHGLAFPVVYEPALHAMHTSDDVAPVTVEYVPANEHDIQ